MKNNIQINLKILIPLILTIVSGIWYTVHLLSIAPRDFEIDSLRKQLKQSTDLGSGYQTKIESLEVKIEWLKTRLDLEKASLIQKEGMQTVQRAQSVVQADTDINFPYQSEKGIESNLLDSLIYFSIEGTIAYDLFLQYPNAKVPSMAKWIKNWKDRVHVILMKGSKEDLSKFLNGRKPRSSRIYFNRNIHYINLMDQLKDKTETLNRILLKK